MSTVKDFKKFANKGNIFDLAIGVIMGSAFTAIVNSLVNDIISPLAFFIPLVNKLIGGVLYGLFNLLLEIFKFAIGLFSADTITDPLFKALCKSSNLIVKQLDNEMKSLDTEHNALKTEFDSVKSLIGENVEKTFNLFS